jgi:integrase
MDSPSRHPHKALTALKINRLNQPGRYADGNGLYLVVDPSGAKRWVLRTVVQGKRRDIGLGGLRLVSLSDARLKALEYRKMARDGGNPIEARRQARVTVPTFSEAANRTVEQHRANWKNPKSVSAWNNTLTTYVYPAFGEKSVDQIETSDVLRALSPIWLAKPETARRIRRRIAVVMDWAKAAGYRTGDNPVEGVDRGLPRHTEKRGHFVAIPYADVPEFVRMIPSLPTNLFARLGLEFLILTAARTNEVLRAEWSELDLDKAVWTVPAERMKAGRAQRVPLAERALALLRAAQESGGDSNYIFPGRKSDEPMSNMVFLMMLRRMGATFTAHGFRSAFRDWAAECTNFPREVCEMALAHSIKDKTEAAYRRGDLFEKRRELMIAWASELHPVRLTPA